jgi:hypothetical protein
MNTQSSSELPPVDFVAFLAQRAGLSQEDAEHRLERWLGEYHHESAAAHALRLAALAEGLMCRRR